MAVIDHTRTPALLRKKVSRNPLPLLWRGWIHFAYFFCPPGEDPCLYCFLLRMFLLGLLLGWHITYLVMR